MQASKATSDAGYLRRSSLYQEPLASEFTIGQFLKYLELLKLGESALREQVEKDEESAEGLKQKRSPQTKNVVSTRRSSNTLDGIHLVRNYKETVPSNVLTEYSHPLIPGASSQLSLNPVYFPAEPFYPNGVEDGNLKSSARSGSCSPKTVDQSSRNGKIANCVIGKSREDSGVRNRWNGGPPGPKTRNQFPKMLQDLRPNSSIATVSAHTGVAQAATRRLSFVDEVGRYLTRRRGDDTSTLPVIRLSCDDSILLPRMNRSFVVSKRSELNLDTERNSTRLKIYSDNNALITSRRLARYRHSPSGLDEFKKSQLSNAKSNPVFKEEALPCPYQCAICYLPQTSRPVRLYYSHLSQVGRTAYLDGIADGNGKSAWPVSRKKELKGLVYNRLTHSFHPPIPKRWMKSDMTRQ